MSEYPLPSELREIKEWDFSKRGVDCFIDTIERLWKYSEWNFRYKNKLLSMSTLGWSGNEQIIMAMKENYVFWGTCFYMHKVGGHYKFKMHDLIRAFKKKKGRKRGAKKE